MSNELWRDYISLQEKEPHHLVGLFSLANHYAAHVTLVHVLAAVAMYKRVVAEAAVVFT